MDGLQSEVMMNDERIKTRYNLTRFTCNKPKIPILNQIFNHICFEYNISTFLQYVEEEEYDTDAIQYDLQSKSSKLCSQFDIEIINQITQCIYMVYTL